MWIIPVFYLAFSLVILWWINDHSYSELLQWYSVRWPDAYNAEDLARNYFTIQWYEQLRAHQVWWTVSLSVLFGGYLFYTRAVWSFFETFFRGIGKALSFLINTFRQSSRAEKAGLLLLFGAILAYRVYFFIAFPPQTDETFSYLFFVRQGFILSAVSYPSTNNHIFYSLVCSLLNKAHVLSPMAVMRLPDMFGDLILFYGIFCICRYWGDFRRAMAVVAGTAFCYMLSYYAVIGRGYQWQEICAVVSLLGWWGCFFAGKSMQEWTGAKGLAYPIFIISSIVGAYINPLFIYHFLALILLSFFLFMRRKEYGQLFVFLRSLFVVGAAVAVLYLPLILGSSWRGVTNNEFVAGFVNWHAFLDHYGLFIHALKIVSGYGEHGVYVLLIALILCLYGYRRWVNGGFYDYAAGYFLASILALAMVTVYKRVYPPERSLCFWQLAINIIFVNTCYDILFERYFRNRATVLLVAFLLAKVGGSVKGLYWKKFSVASDRQVMSYREVERDFDTLEKLHPASWQITDSDDFYSMFGKLRLVEERKGVEMVFNRREAVGDVLFLPDIYVPGLSLKGYRLWADRRLTAKGHSLAIYVAERLLKTPENGHF